MDRSEANEVDRNERSVCEAERGKWRWAKERKEEAWMRRVSERSSVVGVAL
jgi:hypothetical protein